MRKLILLVIAVSSLNGLTAIAQYSPEVRAEDHLFRRRVLLRLDLQDKRNLALSEGLPSDNYLAIDSPFRYQRGVSAALLLGYHDVRFMGYEPDTLSKPLLYKDFLQRTIKLIDVPLPPSSDELDTIVTGSDDSEPWDDMGLDEDFFELKASEASVQKTVLPDSRSGDALDEPTHEQSMQMALGYSVVIELLEDEMFDKNKSTFVYVPQYIRLVFVSNVNGVGAMPMVAFKYKDIEHVLANTYWRNKHNDANAMNIKDIIRLRLFSSIVLNLSGETVYNLKQAARKRQQLLQFEHHLWSF